jgi:hypothetical protein
VYSYGVVAALVAAAPQDSWRTKSFESCTLHEQLDKVIDRDGPAAARAIGAYVGAMWKARLQARHRLAVARLWDPPRTRRTGFA